ncbi:putative DASH complex protein [Podospora fimiseda]|uniref:DASH complex subunit SPC19 n=1 Tax=Podospora fimiseda TaxID=252190 RepID=A0AAN7BQ24_9PEZI|nr:putative DASH complex protein [Podospora fimiseda]
MSINPTYSSCVSALRTSLNYLESSVSTLDQGVSDFPRITKLLKTVRHYELLPQHTIHQAESSLQEEIGPFIAILLDKAEKNLERQGRKIETLKARKELNAGRLGGGGDRAQRQRQKEVGIKKRGERLDEEQALRVKVLRQRKEALKYSVERLEMEVREKERELRGRLERGGVGGYE